MGEEAKRGKARFRGIDRGQTKFKVLDIESLLPEDHSARRIWEVTGQLNLVAFEEEIKAVEGVRGRDAWDPRMMITLWIYAYSRGVGSAREVSRLCKHEPAFVWITGDQVVNYHSLSSFRTGQGDKLKQLFIEVLAAMKSQGLISLVTVMHDGTKIEAQASTSSFRREETIQKHLEEARQQVERMEELADENGDPQERRKRRTAKERKERLEKALEELAKIQANKKASEKKEARVSMTEPEARVMKMGQGGYEASYNVQVSTEAKNKIIVGVGVSQCSADAHELEPALKQVEDVAGEKPQQLVVDGGYITGPTIVSMSAKKVNLYGPAEERSHEPETATDPESKATDRP